MAFETIAALGAGAYALGKGIYNHIQSRRQERREDNAVQRRTQDLIRAGLSPVLAAGSPASSTATASGSFEDNPFMEWLTATQGKANIAATNAGTELAKMQATSEQWKQLQMDAGIKEITQRIANMQSEKQGIDLRNSWINADMASSLKLRDTEIAHKAQDTLRLAQDTELLKAKTTYEQTAIDKLLTDIDNAKILRDINMIDRDWRDYSNMSSVWNNFSNGSTLKMLLGGTLFGASALERYFPKLHLGANPRDNWYYPKK